MSVFTPLSKQDVAELLTRYSLGELTELRGVAGGVTNTIYYLATEKTPLILTLFEDLSAEQLPFYLQLMTGLAAHGIKCPKVFADQHGETIQRLKQKPVVLMSFLAGEIVDDITPSHCQQIGDALAHMHVYCDPNLSQPRDQRGQAWREQTAQQLLTKLVGKPASLLRQCLQDVEPLPDQCRKGIIHADLFPDNALFTNGQLTALLDFYYACHGSYLYDLAITVNAWCFDQQQQLSIAKFRALVNAYLAVFPEMQTELAYFKQAATLAGLRFWLSR